MSGELQQKDFAQYLNDRFQVLDENITPFELELIEVSEEKVAPKQRMFSLVFHGPTDKFIPQRTYKLQHSRMGVREIFLVPVGQDEQGFQYQAVFNNLS